MAGCAAAAVVALGPTLLVSAPAASAAPALPMLAVVAGNGTSGAATPGPATSSSLTFPFGVASDEAGDVYIADTFNQTIEKVDLSGTLSVIAGTGTAGSPTPGPATDSSVQNPFGVAVDGAGNVYIADTTNQRIEKVTPSGTLSFLAGNGASGHVTPGPATSSSLNGPFGIAADSAGDVFIADTNNNQIEEVTPSGTLSVVAGNGTQGSPTPGPATSSSLSIPSGVAVSNGNLYIADTGNSRIEKVTPSGTLSIVAGTGTPGQPTAGRATDSALNGPHGVAADASGNVYIADTDNERIEVVNPRGTLSLLAGTGHNDAYTPGPAGSSALSEIWGVAVDAARNLFVADNGSHVIETITGIVPDPPTAVTAALAGTHVEVSWTPPSTGPTPADYTVTPIVDGAPGEPIVVTGPREELTNPIAGATYSFTVTADSSYGDGPASAASNTVAVPAGAAGYWLVAGDGGVFAFGNARFYGSTGNLRLNQPVVGMTGTADGKGYWLVARDGGVFSYGDARFSGSVPARAAQVTNVVGIAADPRTGGYWIVADDGGVYAEGAPWYGSVPGLGEHVHDIVGIAPTPDGRGYLVVGADGVVYPFGDATQQGEPSSLGHLRAPVVGIDVDHATGGYWIADAAGAVYAYGAPFHGSAGALHLAQPIAGVGATTDGSGYDLVAIDGGVFAYRAPFLGSMGGTRLNVPMVGMAAAGEHVVHCLARPGVGARTAVC